MESTYITEGVYLFKNKKTDEFVDWIEPIELIRRYAKQKGVMKKDGEVVVTSKRKYPRKLKQILEFKIHDQDQKTVTINEDYSESSGNGPKILVIIHNKQGKEITAFHLSNKQAWEMKDSICDYYMEPAEDSDVELNVSNETKVYMILLKHNEYMISTNNLVKAGMKLSTASELIKSMVKRKILVPCGQVGKSKYYTATIPKDKLREMFIGKGGKE